MGCNTCKTQKQTNQNNIGSSIPNNLNSENIFIRIIAFFSVMISLPFIFLVLLGQVFIAFFLPKFYDSISKKFSDAYKNVLINTSSNKVKAELEKREEQFKDNGDYTIDSNLLSVNVYDDNNETNKDEE